VANALVGRQAARARRKARRSQAEEQGQCVNWSRRSPMTRRHHLRLTDVPSVLVTLTLYLQHRRMDSWNTLSMPLRDHRLGAGTSKGITDNTVTLRMHMWARAYQGMA